MNTQEKMQTKEKNGFMLSLQQEQVTITNHNTNKTALVKIQFN